MSNGNDAQERRVRALIEGVKGLILINGGAAAALLAFVQAIWGKAHTKVLVYGAIFGFLFFGAGVALAAGTLVFRYWRGMRCQSLHPADPMRSVEMWLYAVSGILFLLGVGSSAVGALIATYQMPD
jgi:hypothetical protein